MKQLKEKRYVKFFLHASGNIAAKFSYDQVAIGLLASCHSVEDFLFGFWKQCGSYLLPDPC